DGGWHWKSLGDTRAGSPSCPWTGLAFSSRSTGWITTYCWETGGKPELLVSRDGGVTWKSQSVPATVGDGATLFPPGFFEAANGVVASIHNARAGTILATSDGGQTWSRMTLPGQVQLAGNFVDPRHGWLLAGSRDLLSNDSAALSALPLPLYRTSDGGST